MPEESRRGADWVTKVGLSERDSWATQAPMEEATMAPDGGSRGRYDLREEIGRGGMGEVYRTIDRTLGRPVAVKLLQSRFDEGSTTARRFLDEARISAQLQHPGIPPIHDLGTLPDGRPFLAMKLIKGRTLEALLRERTETGADRGRFLAVFEQACQAVAYAHSRRVIHRDLKPQNVMVGAFGEVQVMDWGLAKVLGETAERSRSSDSDERLATEILTARDDSDGSETQAGSVLGTPAYMAPEQAVGAVEQVDERSDVFGLGAVLAVILTGQPPFVADSAESTRVLAARGKVDDCFARLDACGAEPELVALCKRCLSPEREDRPANAGAIASDVAAFRAEAEDRARLAELDRVRAEGERARLEAESRAQRQKRRTQFAVATGLIGLLVVVGAAWLSVRNQAEARRNDADRLASVALGRAEELERQAGAIDPTELFEANAAVKLWEQAEAAVAQAESAVAGVGGADVNARVGEAAKLVRSRLAAARRDASLLAALENAEGADGGSAGGSIDYQATRRLYHSAFEEAGLPIDSDPATLAAAVRRERPGLRGALLRALDRWTAHSFHHASPDADRVRTMADLIDGDPIRKEIRAADASGAEALLRLYQRLSSVDLPPSSALLLGDALVFREYYQESVRLLRRACEEYPSDHVLLRDLSWALGGAYPNDPVRVEESIGYARTLVALRPNNAMSHFILGQALCTVDAELRSAEFQNRKAIELNPRFALAMNNLAILLLKKGDVAGAEQMLRRAVEIDPQDTWTRATLASLLLTKGDLAGAEAEYRKVIELDPKDQRALMNLPWVQRAAPLLPRLDDVAAGRSAPATPAEGVDFADLCYKPFRRQYAAAVRLCERAFSDDPKLAEDLARPNRYNAACSAALSASGQGVDAPTDPADRATLRGKSLNWLRADLAVWSKQASSDNPAERKASADKMAHWLRDGDFVSVRPGSAKFDLPADERAAWESFWADVRATLAAAQKPVPPAPTTPKP
jgi:eukaryotic-like serine/threonine-protein kinase